MNLDNTKGFDDKAREGCINQTSYLTLGEEHKAQLEHLFFQDLSPQMAALSPGTTHPLLPSPFIRGEQRAAALCPVKIDSHMDWM